MELNYNFKIINIILTTRTYPTRSFDRSPRRMTGANTPNDSDGRVCSTLFGCCSCHSGGIRVFRVAILDFEFAR